MQHKDFGNQEETQEPIPEMKDPSYTENETYPVPPDDVVAFRFLL